MNLGELEKKIMEHIWKQKNGSFTVREITNDLEQKGDSYAYNTILTVMTHLYEKKLLSRKKKGKHCVYSVKMNKSTYVGYSSRAIFEKMQKEFGAIAIAHFADLVENIDPTILAEAKKKLEKK